jgi:hypothetical protein
MVMHRRLHTPASQSFDRIDVRLLACSCVVCQDVLWWGLYQVEPLLVGSWLRRKALEECMRHIHYEVGRVQGRAARCCLPGIRSTGTCSPALPASR